MSSKETQKEGHPPLSHCSFLGQPAVDQAAIEAILAERKVRADREQQIRFGTAIHRREAEYHYLHRIDATTPTPKKPVPVVPMSDIDARVVLFNQLCLLFRVYATRARVKRRLEQLEEAQLHASVPLGGVKNHVHRDSLNVVATLPPIGVSTSLINSMLPVVDRLSKPVLDSNIFCNLQFFNDRPARIPLEFRTKHYTGERFPEFSIDVSDEATNEFSVSESNEIQGKDMPDLAQYTQPLVTLETHGPPLQTCELLPVTPFGAQYAAPNYLLSDQRASDRPTQTADSGAHETMGLGSAFSVERIMCAIPQKMDRAVPEDALSDGAVSDDDNTYQPFEKDLTWVPKVDVIQQEQGVRDERSPADLLDYLMYKYF